MARRKECIFCGQRGKMSKEHLFGDGVRKLFPDIDLTHHPSTALIVIDEKKNKPNALHKSGHGLSKTYSCVCSACNNGWMSSIDDRALPTLRKMREQKDFVLNPYERENLGRYAFLKAQIYIAQSHDDVNPFEALTEPLKQSAKRSYQRSLRYFKENICLPAGYQIFMTRPSFPEMGTDSEFERVPPWSMHYFPMLIGKIFKFTYVQQLPMVAFAVTNFYYAKNVMDQVMEAGAAMRLHPDNSTGSLELCRSLRRKDIDDICLRAVEEFCKKHNLPAQMNRNWK